MHDDDGTVKKGNGDGKYCSRLLVLPRQSEATSPSYIRDQEGACSVRRFLAYGRAAASQNVPPQPQSQHADIISISQVCFETLKVQKFIFVSFVCQALAMQVLVISQIYSLEPEPQSLRVISVSSKSSALLRHSTHLNCLTLFSCLIASLTFFRSSLTMAFVWHKACMSAYITSLQPSRVRMSWQDTVMARHEMLILKHTRYWPYFTDVFTIVCRMHLVTYTAFYWAPLMFGP